MRVARSGDFWSGLALAALGTYVVSEARRWSYMGEDGPGAGFFPLWYGGAMIALSLLLVAGAALKRPVEAREPTRWPDLRRALSCWLAFVACIALMKAVGFAIAYALLTWFIVAVMARRPQAVAIAVAVGASAAFYALFELALGVSLPKGALF
ncbi:MAG TPA: tripartite tricarboxylate transporter TctB family protein [Usitatibacter sp.]|nr:tripartite tricarboxylate transporter TctB family protein [Usitatibacter sp.]